MPKRTNPPDPAKAVAYLRVSTDRQDLSPAAQREAIRAWAEREGVEVAAWHEDQGSGGDDLEKRPGLLAALDAVRDLGAGVLVVAKRDRVARDVLNDALVQRLCERQGATVVSADGVANGDRPEDQLMRSIVAAMAAYERALIGARTRAALAVKKARGERVGGIPYGHRPAADGVKLEEHPQEQQAVALARRLRDEGMSLRAIGRALLDAGHTPRKAARWHVAVLSRMVGGPRDAAPRPRRS